MDEVNLAITPINIYVAAVCENDDYQGVRAGVRFVIDLGIPLNVSEPLPGNQTFEQADLTVAQNALVVAKDLGFRTIHFFTASYFLLNVGNHLLPLQAQGPGTYGNEFNLLLAATVDVVCSWNWVENNGVNHPGFQIAMEQAENGKDKCPWYNFNYLQ